MNVEGARDDIRSSPTHKSISVNDVSAGFSLQTPSRRLTRNENIVFKPRVKDGLEIMKATTRAHVLRVIMIHSELSGNHLTTNWLKKHLAVPIMAQSLNGCPIVSSPYQPIATTISTDGKILRISTELRIFWVIYRRRWCGSDIVTRKIIRNFFIIFCCRGGCETKAKRVWN